MIKNFKPMLAATCTDTSKLTYPVLGSVKLDGIRCTIFDGVAYSRSLKPIRNAYVQCWAALHADVLEGLDGELIVGAPNAEDVFRVTTSGVMSEDGQPDFTFYVFDLVEEDVGFKNRIFKAFMRKAPRVMVVNQFEISNEQELLKIEADFLADGFEGVMVKDPDGTYKFGRSTERSGQLLKVKRFVDAEFTIVGFTEKMHNTNEAKLDELGHTERSQAKEGLVPAGTLGSIVVDYNGQQLGVGSGFDDKTRQDIWNNREFYLGKLAKVKYFEVGVKDLPRFPVFLGIRLEDDL